MPAATYFVFTTCSTASAAETLGRRLVEERLAACATALPGATSHYRWQGALERAAECVLLLKTTGDRLPALETRLLELHPYDCPEFVALEASRVSGAYAAWVAESVARP